MKKGMIILLLIFCSCNQQETKEFTIDAGIKDKVKNKIKYSELLGKEEESFFYETEVYMEYFEDDKLEASITGKSNNTAFRSFYFKRNDTLSIMGAYGMFDGSGFSVKIYEGEAEVYALVTSGETPYYSLNEEGERKARLDVPSIKSKLILSEYPDVAKTNPIYGYVEFESAEFYSGLDGDNQTKERFNMKVYFKSIHFEL